MNPSSELTSSQPYLIRAWHEWCTDNGLTPYVTVAVDASVQVPREYVKDDEIVLNISHDSTTGLQIGNDYLVFKARFAGVARDVMVPVDRVLAIFARETGQGMAFPKSSLHVHEDAVASDTPDPDDANTRLGHLSSVPDVVASEAETPASQLPVTSKTGTRPTLTRIK
ncbi:ClpXP protease specificity-enhancing factor [Rhodoferax sp.]|uniref:ClpXP protease specificity-enhancing factor n=1 Tax=Rhodoferax sp. TaxID=50421 RepID=UPI0008D7D8ED|nr:ClpXP protease specificity-enhancing factor [Rhodoferax sp.]OGB42861.1 MAG: ClpXP protease specificity-enhancing factor [Burkholderiales bacterium RIFOXYC2_FULL_59_8]OGB53123.1 MAG: ClpXP protease specificity-enhancing factor [Burkholderiales bacterium RIFOXYD12_FULL_59_19]OGB85018.1 MAG: ClpXP protease specificity-enhancing factor [Burkholderiales bacterium RIFOXYD2_FULL_59_8]MDO8320243.1 ClpXP protease specificity-enhancing factor [Rhodoferax sp.]MDP2677370.1 ClpXP protease specificity-en